MPLLREHRDPAELSDRLRTAHAVTAELMSEIIGEACRRFPSMGQSEKTARIERLLRSEAWTDAALALIDLELPLWQVRRIAYDEGEWYCALSRERELPDWLDRSIEARHADLPLAILSAFVEAQRVSAPASQSERPDGIARREPALRAGLLRQFRVTPRIEPASELRGLGAASQSVARTEIDPGARSLFPAHEHPGRLRGLRQRRLRQGPCRTAVDVRSSSAPSSARCGASRRSTQFSTTGTR